MKIAVIGYGSLVNHAYSDVYDRTLEVERPEEGEEQSEGLNIAEDSSFVPAGTLKLPICLGRLSAADTDRRRITMVLAQGASDEKVFYAKSRFTNLTQAIKNLREREGIPAGSFKNIGFVNVRSGTKRSRVEGVADRISEWARAKGYDAAIWTDLPPKGIDFTKSSTGREILPLLQSDPILLRNTQNYIRDLPLQSRLQRRILDMVPSIATEPFDPATLTADFSARDNMPQTPVSPDRWFDSRYGLWGPRARALPQPEVPPNCNPIDWKRARIVEAAKYFTGLPYKRTDGARGHFPARGCGLDCSNFVAWVYNYGLGIPLSSDVDLLCSPRYQEAGRLLAAGEPLKKGDIILLTGNPKHVVIYIDENHVIDSTSSRTEGVGIRDMRTPGNRWYRPDLTNPRFIGARRVIE